MLNSNLSLNLIKSNSTILKYSPIALFLIILLSCEPSPVTIIPVWKTYDEATYLSENADHPIKRMQYKLIQSKVLDKNDIWKNIQPQISDFSEEEYNALSPLIYENEILKIQQHIKDKKLSYEKLTKWYLYRIAKYENDSTKTLHTIIAINPNAVSEAKKLDNNRSENDHPIYGMPILLKDNIDAKNINTTAGAIALKDNRANDAFIVQKLKSNGAIILGKVNLSEWAYFFCSGCPVGYSAIGGQTLNPYGRMKFETGGSSSGSGTAMAANYAVAAIGTETSGSILSPSGQNSIVGLKPTVGLLSRSGIVPISSTLDTPGPMTRTVMDNAILLSALVGKDQMDTSTVISSDNKDYLANLGSLSLRGIRLGANINFLESDSLYKSAVEKMKTAGAEIVEFEPEKVNLDGFLTLLNIDMKFDLPSYLVTNASQEVKIRSIKDVIDFNLKDTLIRAPYGQDLFEGIVNDSTTQVQLAVIKDSLKINGKKYFDVPMEKYKLDAILSINNYNAGQAAVAHYPCLTVPMGYKITGEPVNITFIGQTLQEQKLLKIGYAFEQLTKSRIPPSDY